MKKLITLILIVISSQLFSQDKLPIKEFEINTNGATSGLVLPAGFRIILPAMYISGVDTTGWDMEVEVATYVDSTYKIRVLNDSIPTSLLKFYVPKSYIDSTNSATIGNFVFGRLSQIYGPSNIVIIK